MHLAFVLSVLATLPLALGAATGSQDTGQSSPDIPCEKVTSLVHALQADSHGSEFCNELLQGKRGTKTVTKHKTVHPPRSTHTVVRGATAVTTATATSYTSTSIFTSTITSTQTCTPSFNGGKKLEASATPTAVHGQPEPSVLAACACLDVSKPKPKPLTTITVTHTSICPAKTIRVTSFSTNTETTTVYNETTFTVSTPVTPITTVVTATAIFAATGVPQHTVISNLSTAIFNEYENLDFYGFDVGGCQCDGQSANGTCTFGGTLYNCQGFTDCQTVCAEVNDNAQQATCLGVTWATNGADGRGVCYIKSRVPTHNLAGCGTYRTDYTVDSAILLFANYTYPDPYPPQ